MTLEDLGYNVELSDYRHQNQLEIFEVGRVIAEHKERYIVKNAEGEYDSELIGKLRFAVENRLDLPAVGDWVAFTEYDESKGLIHALYPRKSIIERQAVGKHGQKQIIATNIDVGIIIQSVDRDFNINRLERYLTICHASKIAPIILFNKIDTISKSELNAISNNITSRIKEIPIIAISNLNRTGYDELLSHIKKGLSYCLLGSSGVGKSTLANNLSGREHMKTGEINDTINRGRHITSHRELIILENGGILIDNPGMREVGITDSSDGIEMTFDQISQLSQNCKFNNCAHINEKGCAILEALENDEISSEVYYNYQKMIKEKVHFESSIAEKRKKDKQFGKMYKEHKKGKKLTKY